jgi:4-hydroxy-tetrahydrodipicolinate synthase
MKRRGAEVVESFGDILTAMVTPFTIDLQVDSVAFVRLADHLLASGSDGLVVAGTTGEAPTLTDDEKVELFRHAVAVSNERGPVIAGTGTNDTEHSVKLTRRAEDAGVDGVLCVTPYYNKPPERGLRAHFEAIAAATTLPVIIYNIPSRCVTNLSPEFLAGLSDVDNIVAVKQANPDLAESRRLMELCDMGVYAGNDDMTLDIAAMGGWGCISVASHLVGRRLKELVTAARAGDLERAREIDRDLAPLFEMLFITSNPIPLKAALSMLGQEVGGLRLPLVEASDAERRTVETELERLGLL